MTIFRLSLIGLCLVLVGCKTSTPVGTTHTAAAPVQASQTPDGTATVTLVPSQTPTTAPPRSLVICLGQEPASLYIYGSSFRSTWSVLEAVYDGPIDTRMFEAQAVILEKMPQLPDGDAFFQPVEVSGGDEVVNLDGDLVALAPGSVVLPSGCTEPECAVQWDGAGSLLMDQLVVRFNLLPGITWSDGTALTASDSVYSFTVASDGATPVSKNVIYRTASYQALDERRIQWSGVPGYFPVQYSTIFWTPLPEHILGRYQPQDLLSADEANRYPLGWGPYIVEEWVSGDHILLQKNDEYFRAAEGLPEFDYLVYRFLGEPGENTLAALLTGECDIVDQTAMLDEQLEQILGLQDDEDLEMYVGLGPEWEHLDFGIVPASHDDGYSQYYGDRPDFFGDSRTRQAFAYCADRQGIIDEILLRQSSIPTSYLPPAHPLFTDDLEQYPFDVDKGMQLLDEVGWKDWDANPETPLQAIGIPNIPDGTFLSLSYYTTEAPQRVEVAEHLATSMAECGIKLNLNFLDPDFLYAPGAEGILFGRNFDLAQFSWKSGSTHPCIFYESSQIPNLENNWLTVNITGFQNPAYDAACQAARATRIDQENEYYERHLEVQKLFVQELPVIPLFYRLKIVIIRPDFCGFEMDIASRSVLWNLEEFDFGENCT
jgi:peptide/nickel transport system substrate-binding protein